MNLSFFIAKRIAGSSRYVFAMPAVRIAVLTIAVSLTVMILSLAVVSGFNREIKEKVIGFAAHIVVDDYDDASFMGGKPLLVDSALLASVQGAEGVEHCQRFAYKPCVIKTDDQIQGAVLKGVGSEFDWRFFRKRLIAGNVFQVRDSLKTNEAVISRILADKLKLKTGESFAGYFVQEPFRMRKFTVCGIYETGLEDFDQKYVLCDLGHVQKLNGWEPNEAAGLEVLVKDFSAVDAINAQLNTTIPYQLYAQTIKEINPQIFDWLSLVDRNAWVVLVLMAVVACVTMVSTLLILILEKTSTIGILKSMGGDNGFVRKVFVYNGLLIIGRGVLYGNLVGLLLCFLQLQFGLIKLDQASYFVAQVPVLVSPLHLLALNAGFLLLGFVVLLIPALFISRVTPAKAIRFS